MFPPEESADGGGSGPARKRLILHTALVSADPCSVGIKNFDKIHICPCGLQFLR